MDHCKPAKRGLQKSQRSQAMCSWEQEENFVSPSSNVQGPLRAIRARMSPQLAFLYTLVSLRTSHGVLSSSSTSKDLPIALCFSAIVVKLYFRKDFVDVQKVGLEVFRENSLCGIFGDLILSTFFPQFDLYKR